MKRVRNRLRDRWRGSVARRAAELLPYRQRRKLALLVLVQVFLGSLDLVAVALVGLLGTLAVADMQSQRIGPSGTIGHVLRLLHLHDSGASTQMGVLAILTGALFIARTMASIYLIRRALHFLGTRSAEASAGLVDRLLQQPLTFLQTRSTQDFIYSTTTSTNALVLGVLGSIVIMSADAAMLVAMGAMLLYVAPVVALLSGAMLAAFVAALHRLTTGRATHLGEMNAKFDVESRDLLTEAIATFRDMHVRGSQAFYSRASREVRLKAAAITAEWTFLPNVSKYVLESAVIVGALSVSAVEFALENVQRAVGVLTLFLASGTRLAPAIIRLQQGASMLRYSAGQGSHALLLSHDLAADCAKDSVSHPFSMTHEGFSPSLRVARLTYRYPKGNAPAIADLSVDVEPGQFVAIVGPSGAGKSTLADLLLGVLTPDSGLIQISGLTPSQAARVWPGAIAYVPQDVWVADGSVRHNITLGFDATSIPESAIWRALVAARLDDFVRALPEGLGERVGERGAKMSGGQRQRLGIARALLTQPRFIILDEATSSLDASTEQEVTTAIGTLQGSATVLVIAHRLATVRRANMVLYIEAGVLRSAGSFEEVRRDVPDFDRQAALLGL